MFNVFFFQCNVTSLFVSEERDRETIPIHSIYLLIDGKMPFIKYFRDGV